MKIVVANEFTGRCDATSPPYPDFCEQVMDNVQTEEENIWWYVEASLFRRLSLLVVSLLSLDDTGILWFLSVCLPSFGY